METKTEKIDVEKEYEEMLETINELMVSAKEKRDTKLILSLIKEKQKILNFLNKPKTKDRVSDMKKK